MAHSLKMDVVAEGVETAEQQVYLTEKACNKLQGYYFSKPLQADDFTQFVANWQENNQ